MEANQRAELIESLVKTTGKGALEPPWPLADSFTEEDYREIAKIVSDTSHPWMIEYYKGLESLDSRNGPPEKQFERSLIEKFKSYFGYLIVFTIAGLIFLENFSL